MTCTLSSHLFDSNSLPPSSPLPPSAASRSWRKRQCRWATLPSPGQLADEEEEEEEERGGGGASGEGAEVFNQTSEEASQLASSLGPCEGRGVAARERVGERVMLFFLIAGSGYGGTLSWEVA